VAAVLILLHKVRWDFTPTMVIVEIKIREVRLEKSGIAYREMCRLLGGKRTGQDEEEEQDRVLEKRITCMVAFGWSG
jgi:hypothetical protein